MPWINTQEISNRIKCLRDRNNLTAAQVAEALAIQESNYRKYENGSRTPKMETLYQLASIFHCSIYDICADPTKRFYEGASSTAFNLVMGNLQCFDEREYRLFDLWDFWGEQGFIQDTRTFFKNLSDAAQITSIEDVFALSDRFFSKRLSDDQNQDFELRLQAGAAFMYAVIDQLDHIKADTISDNALLDEIASALQLPSQTRARQDYLTRIFIPFAFMLNLISAFANPSDSCPVNLQSFRKAIYYYF